MGLVDLEGILREKAESLKADWECNTSILTLTLLDRDTLGSERDSLANFLCELGASGFEVEGDHTLRATRVPTDKVERIVTALVQCEQQHNDRLLADLSGPFWESVWDSARIDIQHSIHHVRGKVEGLPDLEEVEAQAHKRYRAYCDETIPKIRSINISLSDCASQWEELLQPAYSTSSPYRLNEFCHQVLSAALSAYRDAPVTDSVDQLDRHEVEPVYRCRYQSLMAQREDGPEPDQTGGAALVALQRLDWRVAGDHPAMEPLWPVIGSTRFTPTPIDGGEDDRSRKALQDAKVFDRDQSTGPISDKCPEVVRAMILSLSDRLWEAQAVHFENVLQELLSGDLEVVGQYTSFEALLEEAVAQSYDRTLAQFMG